MEDLRSREEQQRLFEEYVERKKISDENKRVEAERLAKEIADKVGTEEEVRPGTVASNKSEPVAEEEEKPVYFKQLTADEIALEEFLAQV